jgi:hypothetical protein
MRLYSEICKISGFIAGGRWFNPRLANFLFVIQQAAVLEDEVFERG